MKYENTKTGVIIVTTSVIHGNDWKLLKPPMKEASKAKKKVVRAKPTKEA